MNETSPRPAPPDLTRFDLCLVFLRSFLIQSAWNFERGLNYGFAYAIAPILRKLYPKEELPKCFQRHLEYFNTQPYMACFILGAVVKLESEKAKSPENERQRRAEEIHALKVGMMGPVAAVGDSLFWATYRPFCVLLATALVFSGAFPTGAYLMAAPVLFLVLFNAGHLGIRALGFLHGWRQGDQVILNLRRYGFQEATEGFKLAATLALGVLLVLVNRPRIVTHEETVLFTLKIAFFGAILALYTFALRKKVGPSQVFYGVVLFALMLAYWPKLSAATGAGKGFFPFLSTP